MATFDKVKNCFPHPTEESRNVYIFSDTLHLIKTIRNRLFDKREFKVDPNENSVKWQYFESLFEIDRKNIHGRLCPKLTNNHINPNNLLKMRVFLAVQIFSNTSAQALLNYKSYYAELEDCEKTAEFCIIINKVFDALNRTKPTNGITLKNADYKVLQETLKWLDD